MDAMVILSCTHPFVIRHGCDSRLVIADSPLFINLLLFFVVVVVVFSFSFFFLTTRFVSDSFLKLPCQALIFTT